MKKTLIAILFFISVGTVVYQMFLDDKLKVDEEIVVMAFGDSLTYGRGDRKEEGYIGILEKNLNEKNPEQRIKFENYGVPGRKSSGVLQELTNIHTTEKLNEADHFIVFIGTNDLIKSNGGDYSPLHHDKIKAGQKVYERNMEAIIKLLRNANKTAPIVVIGIYNPYPNGEEIEKYVDEWNEATIELVKIHEQVVYVSTNDLFKGKNKKDYFSDSLHLDEDGYELLAERVMREYDFTKVQKN